MNETDAPEQKPTKQRARFGLKSLLLLVAFVAVSLSAFQFGHQVGFKKGDRNGYAAGVSAKPYIVSYNVADLLPQQPSTLMFASLNALASEIRGNVHPTTWEPAGVPGAISADPRNSVLIVVQTERGHDEIAAFFEAKRAARGPITVTQTGTARP